MSKNSTANKTMRDALIGGIYERMSIDKQIYFLTADFGAPMLDNIRADYPERFVNVGIAEQNLIGVAAGLALEGFKTFAYAIAPFITMRAYEQVRNNLSLLSTHRDLNVTMVGVGAGVSYDVSGPTHHCLEDLIIMRTLPNLHLCSPSDWVTARGFLDYALNVERPKYIRFDSKPVAALYEDSAVIDFKRGFHVLREGKDACLVTTGFMTHAALNAATILSAEVGIDVSVIDLFMLKPLDEQALYDALKGFSHIITAEEGFIGKGGLDGLVSMILLDGGCPARFYRMGFDDAFVFSLGDRAHLHAICGLDPKGIANKVRQVLSK